MSANSIARAADDTDLQRRVLALAQKEVLFDEELADTEYGRQLRAGYPNVSPLMYPVAVDTEAAYEAALLAGRGAPGHDTDVIPDAALTSAIVTHWPYTAAEIEARKPYSEWRTAGLTGVVNVYQGPPNGDYSVNWGDQAIGDLTLNADGEGEAAHDYAAEGMYPVAVLDEDNKPIKGATSLTVTEPPAPSPTP